MNRDRPPPASTRDDTQPCCGPEVDSEERGLRHMKRLMIVMAAVAGLALWAGVASAGEWHSGTSNICWDCHTMHFSQSHKWDSGDAVSSGTPLPGGNWLGSTGPNPFLLKMPVNELCQTCHDGQTFAPDVLGANQNDGSSTEGRRAGALNKVGGAGAGYDEWKGHTLGSTATPPGFDPGKIGASATWYNASHGLECISCHAQHGPATAYRNLGPYSLGGAAGNARPTYVIASSNTTSVDVWINLASYTAGSGAAATFGPYYANATVSYNRNDATVGTTLTSNRMDTFCGACHGNFHGGPGDTEIGASSAALDGFLRHPTSQVTIGAAGGQGYGGHSTLSRFTGAVTKVKVYSDDAGYTDASPGCVSCHKAHGNQNPFGLFLLSRNASSVNEEGGYASGQIANLQQGYRNLCGQCHGQGN